ncbi:MAG: hypothetical protein M2R45_00014 [Verrucomicrobia subdivision 3 bacterium]|nr:hypothetical protein [Limisphaerales bacterium]MCS1412527.1 hypothetical protein [Limisphaerales bacterium]
MIRVRVRPLHDLCGGASLVLLSKGSLPELRQFLLEGLDVGLGAENGVVRFGDIDGVVRDGGH